MTKSHGWQNITYASYDDLPKNVQSYDNEIWAQKQIDRLKNIDEELEVIKTRNSLLIEYVNKHNKNNISILDYGGGIGLTYFSLVAATNKTIDYNIVELPSICDAGQNANVPIKFYQNIPNKEFDIVYIRTALQYSEDWKTTLSDLVKCNPKYIIFAHLSASDMPTYLTLQMWGDYLIPYCFINEQELFDHIRKYNYNISHLENSYEIPTYLKSKTLDLVYTRGKI